MNCEERSGFLFAHACESFATNQCSACGKNVCDKHLRQLDAGPLCISCWKTQMQDPEVAGRHRDRYGYDPYYYGGYHYPYYASYHSYDADDRHAFDRSAAPEGEGEWEGDPAGS